MKTSISMSICAVILVGAADASAGQAESSTSNHMPKSIACAQETGEPLGECAYHISRDKEGETTITAVFANGFKRRLFFKDGAFLKANSTMSGTGTDTDWSLQDGTHRIRVDDQRYEFPDTLIN